MPARDLYHQVVVDALLRDGWTITADPLRLTLGARDFYIDLAAEAPIAAEKQGRHIAVEVKSFLGASNVRELELAVGQFALYRALLARSKPDHALFLAVPLHIDEGLFSEPVGELMIQSQGLALLVFDPTSRSITRWRP